MSKAKGLDATPQPLREEAAQRLLDDLLESLDSAKDSLRDVLDGEMPRSALDMASFVSTVCVARQNVLNAIALVNRLQEEQHGH